MCEKNILTPNDELPSENDILERIYTFINNNFSKFGHTEIDKKWFNPSWTPFITYCFYKWGNELGFTLGLKRLPKFRDFYIRMEGKAAEEVVYKDKNLKEYLTVDVSWRPGDIINLEKSSSSPILYLALEHEEDTKPEKIVNGAYVGAQIDEVRKLGYIKSFIKILFVRPRYKGTEGKSRGYIELENTIKEEIEIELKQQYIEDHEIWLLISVTLNNIISPSEIILHGYKYNPNGKKLERFDNDKYSIKIN
ncbi:MAG: hypothetical protein JXA98_07740 [Methanosarcinaceae archaeon]|nr:hypothetical protein [Methanosarcinaceae archaeon]